jgi:hypothetical protein
MTRTRPFAELSAKINADPASRIRVEQYKQAMLDAVMVAETLDAATGDGARIEREEDAYLATLRAYIEDLGGELEVRAVFPDRTVVLAPAPASKDEPTAKKPDAARLSRVGS